MFCPGLALHKCQFLLRIKFNGMQGETLHSEEKTRSLTENMRRLWKQELIPSIHFYRQEKLISPVYRKDFFFLTSIRSLINISLTAVSLEQVFALDTSSAFSNICLSCLSGLLCDLLISFTKASCRRGRSQNREHTVS